MSVGYQRRVAVVLLAAVGDAGFALAGASAIREHGLSDRPTEDVDVFAGPTTTTEQFQDALTRGEDALRDAGYQVTRVRTFPVFARTHISDPTSGVGMDVDFAVNWRVDPPVQMSLGPVLSERDTVAGKLSAVYSRAEVRDFLDLDAIRASGRYTDAELLALGHEDDAGFDETMFAQQLSRVAHILPTQVFEYGVTADDLEQVKTRTMRWALTLRAAQSPPSGEDQVQQARPGPDAALTRALEERERALGPSDSPNRDSGRTDPPERSL